MFGYYNEFTFLQRQILCQLFFKDNLLNHYIYHVINKHLVLMIFNIFSIFKFNFYCTESIFYKSKLNSYGVYVVKEEKRKEILYISSKRRCATFCWDSSGKD